MKNGIFVVNGKYTGPFRLTAQMNDHLSVIGTSFPVRSGCGLKTVQWVITNRTEHPKFIAFYVSENPLH